MAKEKPKKFFDCNSCSENKDNYCRLRINTKPTESAKCENITICDFFRLIKLS